MAGLFIAGTNTEVGKTYVATLIAKALVAAGHSVGVYKPAASGCHREGDELVAEDAELLWQAAGEPGTLEQVCPQRFELPVAPPQAARVEGRQVDRQLLRTGIECWRERSEIVLVEGAGGLMSPLSDTDYNIDLASEFGFPLLLVSANELGTINATLQSLITAKARASSLPVTGIVLNQPSERDDHSLATNAEEIAARTEVPILACVGYGEQRFTQEIDWASLAQLG